MSAQPLAHFILPRIGDFLCYFRSVLNNSVALKQVRILKLLRERYVITRLLGKAFFFSDYEMITGKTRPNTRHKMRLAGILWSLKFKWPDRIAYVFLFIYVQNADVTYKLIDAT